MYGPMAGVGSNIKKRLPKWMDWEVAIKVFQNMKNFVDTIKLNQKTAEKRMLSQAVEDILKLYVSMSKGTVPEVVQNNRGNLFDTL